MHNTFVNISVCRSITYVTPRYAKAIEELVGNYFMASVLAAQHHGNTTSYLETA